LALDVLKKLEECQKRIAEILPETMSNFEAVHNSVMKEGNLTTREKILIGLGIVVSKQCNVCITKFLRAAIEKGISLEEIIEACGMSILLNGGPGVAYTTFVVETYQELKAEMDKE